MLPSSATNGVRHGRLTALIKVSLRHVRAIEAGRATQVRVIPGERTLTRRKDSDRRNQSAWYWTDPWQPVLGADVTVVGRDPDSGTSRKARVRITGLRTSALGDMTPLDARACGHVSIPAFQIAWVRDHDRAWMARHADQLDARRVTHVAADYVLLDRFAARWRDREAWVITVVHVEAQHLLADVRKGRGDYTTSPGSTIDMGAECVDAATLERYALKARASQDNFKAALRAERDAQHAARGRAMRDAHG